jgi:ferredoxin
MHIHTLLAIALFFLLNGCTESDPQTQPNPDVLNACVEVASKTQMNPDKEDSEQSRQFVEVDPKTQTCPDRMACKICQIQLQPGMERSAVEEKIAVLLESKRESTYNPYGNNSGGLVEYRDGAWLLRVTYAMGSPAPWVPAPDGGDLIHLPPIEETLIKHEIRYMPELRIFEQGINLREDCSLEVRRSDGMAEIKALPFKNEGKCAFLPIPGTNIPRLEFVRGDYVLIVESQFQSGNDCRAEQAAVVVSRDGKVRVGSDGEIGGCGFNERKKFEILHQSRQFVEVAPKTQTCPDRMACKICQIKLQPGMVRDDVEEKIAVLLGRENTYDPYGNNQGGLVEYRDGAWLLRVTYTDKSPAPWVPAPDCSGLTHLPPRDEKLIKHEILYMPELRIFEQGISLRENCSLEIRRSDGTVESMALPFIGYRSNRQCAVLPVSGTNIPRLEFVRGDWVLIVESQFQSGNDCRAEQVAVVVSRDGKVRTSSEREGSCGFNERKNFEILHHNATTNPK